ncbi:hypothetical protein AVDCRST_MAG94-481, partial [uncultured Leptolyngbya sp.]
DWSHCLSRGCWSHDGYRRHKRRCLYHLCRADLGPQPL